MKATGIVHRVDGLGRIVIPKEIRRDLGIKEGDKLEIFIDEDGGLVYHKYNVTSTDRVKTLCEKLCAGAESYEQETFIRNKCEELIRLVE